MSAASKARAARRALRRHAAKHARQCVQGGLFEPVSGGRGVVRVEAPATKAALTAAIERFFRGGCVPLMERLDHAAALGLPSSANRPPWAERCYINLDLDREGRIAWVTTWAAGTAPEDIERAGLDAVAMPRLALWRDTPGFGADFQTRGRA
jgi:hypothetical protein